MLNRNGHSLFLICVDHIVRVLCLKLQGRKMTKVANFIASPYENLKGFAVSRPPVIIFMVCIALISIILMTLAFIVKDNELKKPDVSQVDYCW